jgi:hypothetical protein
MSTKKTSTTTNQYDAGSKSRYDQWQTQMMPILSQLFQNPTGSPFFNFNLGQQTRAATQVGGRNTSNALLNFDRSGIGGGTGGGGAKQSLLAGLGRYGSSLQFQGFSNAMNQAQSDRWNAASLGQAMNASPLQTGQTNVSKTGGLGTWLPQTIGAVLTGGLSFLSNGGGFGGPKGGSDPFGGQGFGGAPFGGGGSSFWSQNPFGGGPGWGAPGTGGAGVPTPPGGGWNSSGGYPLGWGPGTP